jgi:hypothetical protein
MMIFFLFVKQTWKRKRIERSKGNHYHIHTYGFLSFFKLDLSFILHMNNQILKDKAFLNRMVDYPVILTVPWMINHINFLGLLRYMKFDQTSF